MDRTMNENVNSRSDLTREARTGAVRAHNAIQVQRFSRRLLGSRADVPREIGKER